MSTMMMQSADARSFGRSRPRGPNLRGPPMPIIVDIVSPITTGVATDSSSGYPLIETSSHR